MILRQRKRDLMREEDVVSYASDGGETICVVAAAAAADLVPLNVADAVAMVAVVTSISPISPMCSRSWREIPL